MIERIKRIGGTIEDWFAIAWEDGHSPLIVGKVYGDDDYPDGTPIRTSSLKHVDLVTNKAETRNSIYTLGHQAFGEQRAAFIAEYRERFHIPPQSWEETE